MSEESEIISSYYIVAYYPDVINPILLNTFMSNEKGALEDSLQFLVGIPTPSGTKMFVCKNLPISKSYLVRCNYGLYEYAIM